MQNKSKYEEKNDVLSSTIISTYDLTGYEELDPSLAEGFKVMYDRDIPLELRFQDMSNNAQQDVGTLESIRSRILVQGDSQKPQLLKIEFTSETDLFFHYTAIVDENTFLKLREEQKLNVEFGGFLGLIIKMFNSCQKEPHNYFAVFFMQKDGLAKLDFIQNMEYKFLELLSLEFVASSEEIIRQSIGFRYSLLKAKSQIMQNRLKDISAILKLKNPSLLLQLQKGTTAGMGTATQRNSTYLSGMKDDR
jgi:hypothetical protein